MPIADTMAESQNHQTETAATWERGWFFRWTTPVIWIVLLVAAPVIAGTTGSVSLAGAMFAITSLVLPVVAAVLVSNDRSRHGQPARSWALGILLFGVLTFIVYLRERERPARELAEDAASRSIAPPRPPETAPAR